MRWRAARPALVAALLALVTSAAASASGREEAGGRLLAAALRGEVAPDRALASGWSALHEAAAAGDAASVRALVRLGARPDLRARALGTPLDVAESAGRREVALLLRAAGARGSGKSIGDTVCVRPWSGEGYCAVVTGRDATRFDLRLTAIVGCARGCRAEPVCSAGQSVGAGGLAPGDSLTVPASCLTHTGVR